MPWNTGSSWAARPRGRRDLRRPEGLDDPRRDPAPGEVVALLNAYFGIVVDVVSRHGGLINKFQGDAALAVFGAPEPLDDPAGQALAAARKLTRRLQEELPQLIAGIGVSAGQVVAGHIGAEQRLEYTVSATRSTRPPASATSPRRPPTGCSRRPRSFRRPPGGGGALAHSAAP